MILHETVPRLPGGDVCCFPLLSEWRCRCYLQHWQKYHPPFFFLLAFFLHCVFLSVFEARTMDRHLPHSHIHNSGVFVSSTFFRRSIKTTSEVLRRTCFAREGGSWSDRPPLSSLCIYETSLNALKPFKTSLNHGGNSLH